MHLEFSYTFEDYREANQAHLRRTAVGGPGRIGLLILFICVIVIGASAFFEASLTAPAPSSSSSTTAPSIPQGGAAFIADFVVPFVPWLLVFGFLWLVVFRRLTPRKPASFLYESNAAAEHAGQQRWWPRVLSIAVVAMVLVGLAALFVRKAGPDGLLPLSPWVVVFVIIWAFVFRLLRRQTRHNWDGQPNLHLEYRMDVLPEGVSIMSPVFSSAYRWEAFQRVLETPNLFILFLSTLTFVLIPKRALPDGQAVDELRGMLRTMIAERPAPAFAVVMHAPPPPQ